MAHTELAARLVAVARGGHPRANDLTDAAERFDAAAKGFYGPANSASLDEFLAAHRRASQLLAACESPSTEPANAP